jgi:hypothetical protein
MKRKSKSNKGMKNKGKARPESSSNICKKVCDPMHKNIIIVAIVGVIILIAIAALSISLSKQKSFTETLKEIDEIDQKNGMSLLNYTNGVAYLKYHPRFPDEINLNEYDAVIGDIQGVHELFHNLRKETPSELLVNARAALLESEQHYRIATKTSKGITSDGFKCSDRPYIMEASKNINISIKKGRFAVEALNSLLDRYPKEAEALAISKFWIKNLDRTYDELELAGEKNLGSLLYYCIRDDEENKEINASQN